MPPDDGCPTPADRIVDTIVMPAAVASRERVVRLGTCAGAAALYVYEPGPQRLSSSPRAIELPLGPADAPVAVAPVGDAEVAVLARSMAALTVIAVPLDGRLPRFVPRAISTLASAGPWVVAFHPAREEIVVGAGSALWRFDVDEPGQPAAVTLPGNQDPIYAAAPILDDPLVPTAWGFVGQRADYLVAASALGMPPTPSARDCSIACPPRFGHAVHVRPGAGTERIAAFSVPDIPRSEEVAQLIDATTSPRLARTPLTPNDRAPLDVALAPNATDRVAVVVLQRAGDSLEVLSSTIEPGAVSATFTASAPFELTDAARVVAGRFRIGDEELHALVLGTTAAPDPPCHVLTSSLALPPCP